MSTQLTERDYFTCIDCDRRLEAQDAAYDIRQDGELVSGTICLACADDLSRLMMAWPEREVS